MIKNEFKSLKTNKESHKTSNYIAQGYDFIFVINKDYKKLDEKLK